MSVYTKVLPHELAEFLQNYSLGQLEQFVGISDGIENTNYFVTTSQGEYVLTLFEVLTKDELPYFLELMAFLAEHEIPSAHPVANNAGEYLQELNNKPAALVQRLNGASEDMPNTEQCSAIGEKMGRMHKASSSFQMHRDMVRGPTWWATTAENLMPKLSAQEASTLSDELVYQSSHLYTDLPTGLVHADLFRDNALFVGNELTGIIDFYYACDSIFIYDLAVTINDWCNSGNVDKDTLNAQALLGAYQQERDVGQKEIDAWPTILRAAALRFWLSRLQDKHFPRRGEITHIKNPDTFKQILQDRIEKGDELKKMWS
ncbi:MAG: homoserine kinase [Gammaproteobacteria bacterium]